NQSYAFIASKLRISGTIMTSIGAWPELTQPQRDSEYPQPSLPFSLVKKRCTCCLLHGRAKGIAV
ncbi:MAG TPA: hypothetical protein VH593_08515, partial [Ktedonobacteraceae bacterium]